MASTARFTAIGFVDIGSYPLRRRYSIPETSHRHAHDEAATFSLAVRALSARTASGYEWNRARTIRAKPMPNCARAAVM